MALLTCAFGSVARRCTTSVSRLWLVGWIMIALHFGAYMLAGLPGGWGTAASTLGLDALAWGGVLFTCACVPYRSRASARWMLVALLGTNTLYISLLSTVSAPWALEAAALVYGLIPLGIALVSLRRGFSHPLRWTMVGLQLATMAFVLAVQLRQPNGADLAFDAVICAVYASCCYHFWYAYRRATAGALVTIAGFAAWAAVFVAGPIQEIYFPLVKIDSEVWNLPKYVVAVGMILLLLEDQVEQNKYLALHDELTGLPNRRLFQDRMARTLERAKRNGTRAALLLVDLDHFKRVNDTVGHHVGDLLLQQVSRLFVGRVRRSDTVARTGGDEFCIILEEPTTRQAAESVGESLIALLADPLQVGSHSVAVGASVGIAVFPDDAMDAENLRIAADRNMYAEKNLSRGDTAGMASE